MPDLDSGYTFGNIETGLGDELGNLGGLNNQNLDTGQFGKGGNMGSYTTRLFGSPFQLLDSVDKRFRSINSKVGNEYLRNFLLNSPILNIRPGMPKYTGSKGNDLMTTIGNLYHDVVGNNVYSNDAVKNVLMEMASNGPLGYGSKLQKRFFDFRETYTDYCHYANYMCRSVAKFLQLSNNGSFPNGTFTSTGFSNFDTIRWENYRLNGNTYVQTSQEYLGTLAASSFVGYKDNLMNKTKDSYYNKDGVDGGDDGGDDGEDYQFSGSDIDNIFDTDSKVAASGDFKEATDGMSQTRGDNMGSYSAMINKTTCVQFMVEPTDFSESYTNTTKNSMIEDAIDGIQQNIGSEIAWITNSDVNGEIMDGFLSTVEGAFEGALATVKQLTEKVTGGFVSNLFSGAIQSLKGQKMIYPKIYQSSSSENNYRFIINLKSPYGDVYNYYMNIVVPWLHMLALTAPRLVTANSAGSPFLVQAYIPGMATIQMGIIRSVSFTRNPEGKYASTSGFPNSARIELEIEELYNAMTISPENDPASFMYNETLNDYMCNLAGIIPSLEANDMQRQNAFAQFANWLGNPITDFANSGLAEGAAAVGAEYIEDFVNPY